jgi:ketosteroid isomerase-like protein
MRPIHLIAATVLLANAACAGAPQTLSTSTIAPDRAQSGDEAPAIAARVRELLAAYASNDPEAILRLCDADGVVVYGSDVAEIARGDTELRAMIRDDFRLWHSAHLGDPRDLEIRQGADLAAAFFNVPFRAGNQQEVLVRIATVWRRKNNVWLLVESSNTVPTVGSSAKDLLHK